MSLDLDALEQEQRVIAKYPWWSESETPRADPSKVLAVIQRLREAEREIEHFKLPAHDADYGTLARYWMHRAEDAEDRVARLELVRKAASEIPGLRLGCWPKLASALAESESTEGSSV